MVTTPSVTGGLKHDSGKPRVDLLDPLWLLAVARVLGFGAEKYEAHNWRKGIAQSRLLAAAMRHLLAYNSGEDTDQESGLPHLAHASCCLMFLTNMAATRPDTDDRWKAPPSKADVPPPPQPGEWTPWFGETDDPPPGLTDGVAFRVRARSGAEWSYEDQSIPNSVPGWWRNRGSPSDIVAYRILRPA